MWCASGLAAVVFVVSATGCQEGPLSRTVAEPADLLVVVQAEVDGKPSPGRVGRVIAVGDESAYVRVEAFGAPRADASRPKPVVRYFASMATADDAERVELEVVAAGEERLFTILSGPRRQLPPPAPEMKLPEVEEGAMLTFAGLRAAGNQSKPSFVRVREPVKLSRILPDDYYGTAVGFQLQGAGGDGFLVGERGELLGICHGQSEHFYAFGAPGTSSPAAYFQRTAMRARVSRPSDDEVVVEFVEQTIDPFDSGLAPRMLVAHPTRAQADLPDHELLHGDNCFTCSRGLWLRPPEGTAVDMRRVETVDADFQLPEAPSAWSHTALWYGTYRFRVSERVKPIWYQGAAIDAAGKIVQRLGRDSHLYFPKAAGTAVLFKHPVYQYDQGTPVRMPSP